MTAVEYPERPDIAAGRTHCSPVRRQLAPCVVRVGEAGAVLDPDKYTLPSLPRSRGWSLCSETCLTKASYLAESSRMEGWCTRQYVTTLTTCCARVRNSKLRACAFAVQENTASKLWPLHSLRHLSRCLAAFFCLIYSEDKSYRMVRFTHFR